MKEILEKNMSLFDYFTNISNFFDNNINTNKYFIGIAMILINVGSKFISIQFSKSTEEYLKMTVTKQILVFSMAFLGTRCIITSLILTATFTILSDHLFNEESKFCIVPEKYRVLNKLLNLVDTNRDNVISQEEINKALAVLDKAEKEKINKQQKQSFTYFHNYNIDKNI
jgi:hypothetical protein